MKGDLREWLEAVSEIGELKELKGADWDLEIGALSALNVRAKSPRVLLFDDIADYRRGYRVLTCPTVSPNQVALTMNLPLGHSNMELVQVLREKIPDWESNLNKFPPQEAKTGPILENVHSGNEIDTLEFPAPKWHELDGGRYTGTGDAVITRDPDKKEINLGTYRVMVHDRKTTGLFIGTGKHGALHRDNWYSKGKACPVCISVGHHPLTYRIACVRVPNGMEYNYIGAVRGHPVQVVTEELTGLPIPADSEIVLAGWCPQHEEAMEGPFGEWTGYYASGREMAPIVKVERIYHRNQPVLLGTQNHRGRSADTYFRALMKSARLFNELVRSGIPDVRGVWMNEEGAHHIVVVSIKQRYAGHAKQSALIASQHPVASLHARYVVVVDEDIDPTDIHDVMWAVGTRSDPEKGIDIIRRCWSEILDPVIRKPTKAPMNTRAIIDACKPFEWIEEFPPSVNISPELANRVKDKWGNTLELV